MNEHSPKFELVKNYYDKGQWKLKAVRNAVIKHWITVEEFEEIRATHTNLKPHFKED